MNEFEKVTNVRHLIIETLNWSDREKSHILNTGFDGNEIYVEFDDGTEWVLKLEMM